MRKCPGRTRTGDTRIRNPLLLTEKDYSFLNLVYEAELLQQHPINIRHMRNYAFNRSYPIVDMGRIRKVLKSSNSCIIHLSYSRISVLPEGEEFLEVVYGFTFPALLLVQLGQPVMINRMVWRFRLIYYSF